MDSGVSNRVPRAGAGGSVPGSTGSGGSKGVQEAQEGSRGAMENLLNRLNLLTSSTREPLEPSGPLDGLEREPLEPPLHPAPVARREPFSLRCTGSETPVSGCAHLARTSWCGGDLSTRQRLEPSPVYRSISRHRPEPLGDAHPVRWFKRFRWCKRFNRVKRFGWFTDFAVATEPA